MNDSPPPRPKRPGEKLIAEIRCYLETVEVFRREGCEPRWSSADRTPSGR